MVRALLLIGAVCVLAGCGRTSASSSAPSEGKTVVAGFYPLAWAAQRIAPPGTNVVNLTPTGAEPHDLELTPRDVEDVLDADLVLYVGGGFQPALEKAVGSRSGPSVDVVPTRGDPHVWLDPQAFARVVRRLGAPLDRKRAADRLAAQLLDLDRAYRRGLADCRRRVLVTTHAAFGRLAARYGLTTIALTGRSPESEPTPRDLERIVSEVKSAGVTTVFSEPLVSSKLADTVAREAGARVATLDPLEGLSDAQLRNGADYLSVMRKNLLALREALGCP